MTARAGYNVELAESNKKAGSSARMQKTALAFARKEEKNKQPLLN